MPQVINTNVASLTSQRNLTKSQGELGVALQRLSSGLRLNSAKDDAAGLAISERFTTQIRGLNQASRNANDAISLAQTAEGALGEYGNILQRVRELAIQSANSTNSASDRAALQGEAGQLISELQRVATTTQFNGQSIIDGTFTGAQFQVGANANQTILVNVGNAQTSALGSYQVGNTAQEVTGTALVGGDLLINGTDVGTSVSGSAEDIATAINSATSETGVKASASTETESSQALRRNQTLQSGDLEINSVNVGAVSGSNNIATQGANIAAAINGVSTQTGVTAVADLATGALTLTSSTGKDIAITSSNLAAGYSRLENATGIDVSTSTAQSTSTYTIANGVIGVETLTATAAGTAAESINIGGVDFSISAAANSATNINVGTDAASFGGNIRAAVGAAITAGTMSNVAVTGTGAAAILTSSVATIDNAHITSDASAVTGLGRVETTAGAGLSAGNTLTVDNVTYEFVMPGNAVATTGNIAVAFGATNDATAANLEAAMDAQRTALNTNTVASVSGAVVTVVSDLVGAAGNANTNGTFDITGATAASVAEANTVVAADLAGAADTTRGTIELNSSKQFIISGNGTANAGLQSASSTLSTIDAVDISTVDGANSAIALMDGALDQVNTLRGDLGAVQNRFESTIANLTATSENLSAARSRIRDTDYAAETAALTRAQILQQAGVSILSQANSLPQLVLSLLQ